MANTTTLVCGERDALLVDTFLSDEQTAQLADWIAASERRLSTIYITHGHPDHFFGLKLLRDRFPEARALATPQVVDAMQAALRPESVVPVDQGEAVRGLPRSIIERRRFWVTVSGE